MKRNLIWLFIAVLILFSVVLYGIKLNEMGMSFKNIIIFIVLFISAAVVLGGFVILFTKGIRKKLNEEIKSESAYNEENREE